MKRRITLWIYNHVPSRWGLRLPCWPWIAGYGDATLTGRPSPLGWAVFTEADRSRADAYRRGESAALTGARLS